MSPFGMMPNPGLIAAAVTEHTKKTVILPVSLPNLIAGFRFGVALGVIMVVMADLFGVSSGLGQKIA